MKDYALIVTDTSPLITLAKADALDLLLRLGVTVRIPDIVYLEATREGHVDGERIAAWAQINDEWVRIAPSSRIREWQILRESGERAKDYGEIAAIEVVNRFVEAHPDRTPLLLYEDADLNRFAIRAEVELVTTGTFLAALEEARLIQSADQILDRAAAAGRNVERQREQPGDADLAEALNRRRDR